MRTKISSSLRRAVVVLATCAGALAVAQRAPALDEDFQLAAGRSIRLADTDLVVRFDRVDRDSRCPSDVKCITAGDAAVVLVLAVAGQTERQYELHTTSGESTAVHAGYRVTLVALNPVPMSTRTLRARDYVASLRAAQARLDLRARLQLDGTQLDLRGSGATDADVRALRAEDFPRVVSALAAGTQIGDAGLAALARLPLTELDLTRTAVSDAGLARLSSLRLERIDLTGTRVTDAGLASLTGMPLHSLVLREVPLRGTGLDVIAGLDLRVLDLGRTMVDDASMETLTRARRIVTLDLTNTLVTDRAVPLFDRIAGLSTLVVTGTRIGPDALAGLKQRHPGLTIVTAMPMR